MLPIYGCRLRYFRSAAHRSREQALLQNPALDTLTLPEPPLFGRNLLYPFDIYSLLGKLINRRSSDSATGKFIFGHSL